MKKIVCLVLLAALAIASLTACADKSGSDTPKWESGYTYNPYYNRFKPDAPEEKSISVSGLSFYFLESEIRDKDEIKLVASEKSLNILYMPVEVEFPSESSVIFKDSSGFFNTEELFGNREGNVLTVKNTNERGTYTYDIRIEIHGKDLIYVIHNAHHYDEPCTYATLTFVSEEKLTEAAE